jgi:hypothetical protein
MSNIEQGISNDEVKPSLPFPSVFDIRYSMFCGLAAICLSGSLLKFYAVCGKVTDQNSNAGLWPQPKSD